MKKIILLFLLSFAAAFADSATSFIVGENLSITASADGTAPFGYQWRKNGVNIVGATTDTMVLTNVQVADAGSYSFVVSNSAGSAVSDVAVITVSPVIKAPAFLVQPSSQAIVSGSPVTFTASASNATSYQWQKNGVNIPGANAPSYTIDHVGQFDPGTYVLIATNSAGSTSSAPAVLTLKVVTVIPSNAKTKINRLP